MTHFLKNPNKSAAATKLLLADPCLFGRDERRTNQMRGYDD